ncbi:solute carrier family 25 member 45 [Xylariaceae sp. FL0662B]|nr:solute carrier family 25 member 45 [Xylariaceae sp. FL0662B]
MSADFWGGYLSGAVGILIGNPLDLLKVRLQAHNSAVASAQATASAYARQLSRRRSALAAGAAAPALGYGALNALLFVAYNRSEAALRNNNGGNEGSAAPATLGTTWIAGAIGGLATWVVSAPTELIKCRAQTAAGAGSSSWAIARRVVRDRGVRGLYAGGVVTALRDSIGYGFYFWSYELSSRWAEGFGGFGGREGSSARREAAKVLLCGGLAGVVTWASVFPLDVVKTRVQTQPASTGQKRLGAVEVARDAYREGGVRVFFRGLAVCSVRAFVVNAVQWAVYEWTMLELGRGRNIKVPEPV